MIVHQNIQESVTRCFLIFSYLEHTYFLLFHNDSTMQSVMVPVTRCICLALVPEAQQVFSPSTLAFFHLTLLNYGMVFVLFCSWQSVGIMEAVTHD